MRKLKIIIIVIALVAVTAGVGSYAYLWHIQTRALPQMDGEIELADLKAPVTVYRDEYGVPHLYAESEQDLYLAAGYIMAQDRMWQMDLLRRVCQGRLSEIFGEEMVNTDLLMRALRIPEKSEMVLAQTDPPIMAALQAFTDGVNQYLESHPLPPEFAILGYQPEPWRPEHSVNLIGYMAWDLSTGWETEILLDQMRKRFDAHMSADFDPYWKKSAVVYPDFRLGRANLEWKELLLDHGKKLEDLGLIIFSGSNNWAISGAKSVTGAPILANDMHLGLNSPGIWYQMHQVVEGKLDVTGVALPGQPLVVSGHNRRVAWGFTNVQADDMDFYLERTDAEHPEQYLYNGEYRDMDVRLEKIGVKNGDTVERTLRFTHRGPVISSFKDEGRVISMRWMGNEYSNETRALYLLNRAENWDDFREAMTTFLSVSQNTVYADVDGNIGLYCAAGIPIRKAGDPTKPLPGWTDEFEWKGVVSFDHLPHVFNPEEGFVSSANNPAADHRYPYYIGSWFNKTYRIDRIREMLREKEKLGIDDIKRMHADQKSKLAEKARDAIVGELEKADSLGPADRKALEILKQWDLVMGKDSSGAAIFEVFMNRMLENVYADEGGREYYEHLKEHGKLLRYAFDYLIEKRDSRWMNNVNTDMDETFRDIVTKSFQETVTWLSEKMGPDPRSWSWGKIHPLTLGHPLGQVEMLDKLFHLNRGPYPVGGSYHTVCPYSYEFSEPYKVNHGASQRHVYNLADWDQSYSVIPTGVSGIPASPHYLDQTELYVNNRYRRDVVSRGEVEKSARHILVLK